MEKVSKRLAKRGLYVKLEDIDVIVKEICNQLDNDVVKNQSIFDINISAISKIINLIGMSQFHEKINANLITKKLSFGYCKNLYYRSLNKAKTNENVSNTKSLNNKNDEPKSSIKYDWAELLITSESLINDLQKNSITPEMVKSWNCGSQSQIRNKLNAHLKENSALENLFKGNK